MVFKRWNPALVFGAALALLPAFPCMADESNAARGGYFEKDGKELVLVGSSEHYGALIHAEFDFLRYLDEIRACGLNYIRIFSGSYRETSGSFGISANTLAPKDGSFIAPWARTADGRFDLTQWNPDWIKRLKAIVTEAEKRGITVELTLFCPFYDDSLWKISPMNPANHVNGVGNKDTCFRAGGDLLPYQKALARKCAGELKESRNVFFEIINEPYQAKVDDAWQREIIDEIVRTETAFSNKHRIAINVANGDGRIGNPHPAVTVFQFHYAKPEAALRNLHPDRVIGDDETGFAGKDDFVYRREAWEFLLAGGGLFNHLDYSFQCGHEDGTVDWKAPGGGGRAIRRQLGFLRETLQAMPLDECGPAGGILSEPAPQDCRVSVFGNDTHGWLIYLAGKNPGALRLNLGEGTWRATWMAPGTPGPLRTEDFQHGGGVRELRIADFRMDLALKLDRLK